MSLITQDLLYFMRFSHMPPGIFHALLDSGDISQALEKCAFARKVLEETEEVAVTDGETK